MRVLKIAFVLSALVGTAACDRQAQQVRAEDLSWLDTLDLHPVAAAEPAVVSPVELGLVHAPHPAEPVQVATVEEKEEEAPRAAASRSASTERKASSSGSRARRSGGSSAGSGGGSDGGYSAPAPRPRTVEVKNTKRDAVIGAASGAVIGAVAGGPRNRVKGAVIGAAVGGVAGAVIGSTVDKSKRVEYDY